MRMHDKNQRTDSTKLQDLQTRARLCREFINLLKQMDDPRAPAAIERYEAQAAELDQMIAALHPEPVIATLKPATLSGSVPGMGG